MIGVSAGSCSRVDKEWKLQHSENGDRKAIWHNENRSQDNEVTRNLSEPSDQTIMHIDVYADYLSAISPQTTSRALRALLTRGGSKSVRVDNRYTEAYGPHEVMLNIDEINIYTKTMITCDEDLVGQIYVGKEELKVRSIGHWAMLEEDAMHIGTEADVSAHVLDISGKKTQLRGLLDIGAVLSVIPSKLGSEWVSTKMT